MAQQNSGKNVGALRVLSCACADLLRHNATRENVPITREGFVTFDVILDYLNAFHAREPLYTADNLHGLIASDDKGRFEAREILSPGFSGFEMRAVQGHSMLGVCEEMGEPLTLDTAPTRCVHGTTRLAWEGIKADGGISSMQRHHVHCALDITDAAGYRVGSAVQLWLDVHAMLVAEIPWARSKNGVFLCRGLNGVIPIIYIIAVIDDSKPPRDLLAPLEASTTAPGLVAAAASSTDVAAPSAAPMATSTPRRVLSRSGTAPVRSIGAVASGSSGGGGGDAFRKGQDWFGFDVFLSHDWGYGEKNHRLVRAVHQKLGEHGFRPWFDEEQLPRMSSIFKAMSSGIDNSAVFVVFVTKEYCQKVAHGSSTDNCALEFQYASQRRKPENMLAVVVDRSMRAVSNWEGPVGFFLGGVLYECVSGDPFTEGDAEFGHSIDRLVQRLGGMVKAARGKVLVNRGRAPPPPTPRAASPPAPRAPMEPRSGSAVVSPPTATPPAVPPAHTWVSPTPPEPAVSWSPCPAMPSPPPSLPAAAVQPSMPSSLAHAEPTALVATVSDSSSRSTHPRLEAELTQLLHAAGVASSVTPRALADAVHWCLAVGAESIADLLEGLDSSDGPAVVDVSEFARRLALPPIKHHKLAKHLDALVASAAGGGGGSGCGASAQMARESDASPALAQAFARIERLEELVGELSARLRLRQGAAQPTRSVRRPLARSRLFGGGVVEQVHL